MFAFKIKPVRKQIISSQVGLRHLFLVNVTVYTLLYIYTAELARISLFYCIWTAMRESLPTHSVLLLHLCISFREGKLFFRCEAYRTIIKQLHRTIMLSKKVFGKELGWSRLMSIVEDL